MQEFLWDAAIANWSEAVPLNLTGPASTNQ